MGSRMNCALPKLGAAILLLALGQMAARAAAPIAPAAAVAAAQGAPAVFSLARDVAALPVALGRTLRLPLGLIETVLAPLPGLSVASGLRNIGSGIVGPFDFAFAALKLPLSAVNAASQLIPFATGT